MKVYYKWVEAKNFMSFGADFQRLELDNNKLNLIIGNNKDTGKEGLSKNGVGKSSILQAILFCLYGDGFSNIKIDEFINIFNKKNMKVSLCFDINSDEYVITRTRKPNSISISKNGEPFTLSTTKSENEDIIKLIGYDSLVFMNTDLLTNSIDNFINMKPTQQKSFIENLFNVDILSERAISLKSESRNISVQITNENAELQARENNNNRVLATLASLESKSENWDSDREYKINEYKKRLQVLREVNIEEQKSANKELEELKISLSDIQKQIDEFGMLLRKESINLENLNSELIDLRAGKCPKCKQSWTSELTISETEEMISNTEASIERIKEPLILAIDEEKSLKSRIQSFLDNNKDILSNNDLNSLERDLRDVEISLARIQEETINPYIDQINELNDSISDVDKTTLKNLTILGDHYKFMTKLLTDSKSFIRKAIIKQYIPIINDNVNRFLDMLESPNRFQMNDDLSIDLLYMGRNVSMGSLSTGERTRMTFAISMTFKHFNEMRGNGSNLLLIDEIFDSGTDAAGYVNILNILKKMESSVFIISHQDWLKPECDNVITITKENGFSRIDWNIDD